jgi:hypothetical protein
MLRLHIIDGVVVLCGLELETTEYARYAYEGNINEQSHLYGRIDCDDRLPQQRL